VAWKQLYILCVICSFTLGNDDLLALLKIDMKNVFNKCSCTAFFDWDFPEISCWVYWFHSQPAKLGYGHRHVLASTGVQQDDPLGRLLFSLVLFQSLDSTSPSERCLLSLWYLDDGTFIGSRSALLSFPSKFGPHFGLHINLTKCELCWSSGDSSLPGFPLTVSCLEKIFQFLFNFHLFRKCLLIL